MTEQLPTEKSVFQVQFNGVGRNGLCWTQVVEKNPSQIDLARMVKKKKALLSRHFECLYSDEGDGSGFIAAGIRCVGTFQVVELKP